MNALKPIKLERGIPIPERYGHAAWRDTLLKMKLNVDSFLVETDKQRCSVLRSGSNLNLKLVTRKVSGEGYRIWRLE